MSSILLDPNNNGTLPTGYTVIDTEVAFLKNAASGRKLFIRGQRLCTWAKSFYEGRNLAWNYAPSPINDLMEIFPELTLEDAKIICERLGENFPKRKNLSALEILGLAYPSHLWNTVPSTKHAAEWLLWVDETNPENEFVPMIKVVTFEWQQIAPNLSEIYQVCQATTAREVLEKWLGVQITPFIEKFGVFPIPIPERSFKKLDIAWRKQIVETEGTFISQFVQLQVPWQFKQQVALATLDYFEKYSEAETFTFERYNQMARFVPGDARRRLDIIKRVPEPKDMPDTAEMVLKWFDKEYLPFRQWQIATNAEQAYQRILEMGKQFALWYLDFYPQAITSKKHLSFFKSKGIKEQGNNYVNLLVILDGLHALDARVLMGDLLNANGAQQLTITENSFCFAPLPTVTDFAKGALVHGVQPTLMKQMEKLGEDVSEKRTPLPKLQSAEPGTLFIWRIQEPDKTYHTRNTSSLLATEVEGELSKVAKKIIEIAEKLSPNIPLRIIITTDHGRFLGVSQRNIDVPPGMQAHGRAAWGQSNIQFDRTGYKIDGDLVYLSKDRFGLLDDDAAVILIDSAFQHDRYDQEISTHGGLFPEEVIIPWMVFERNMVDPNLDVSISGSGRANMAGNVHYSILNPSPVEVILIKSEINFGDSILVIELEQEIATLQRTEFEVNISSWPSSEQASRGNINSIFRMPSGEEFSVVSPLSALQQEPELYTRESPLEGLDL